MIVLFFVASLPTPAMVTHTSTCKLFIVCRMLKEQNEMPPPPPPAQNVGHVSCFNTFSPKQKCEQRRTKQIDRLCF